MASRIDGRQHLFDVIKVNVFGVKQSRVIILEQPEPGTQGAGTIKIATGGGKVKRDLEISQIAGIESSTERAVEDADRSVTFKFFDSGKEARRTIMFVSKRQRDAFVELVEQLNPRLVQRRSDGSLAGKTDKNKESESLKKDAEKLAKSAASRTSAGVEEADDPNADATRFFAMEENDYGYNEPRMVVFAGTDGDEQLHLIDATAGGSANSELKLRKLKAVAQHASDKSVLELMFHDGSILKSVNKATVLTFGSKMQRERFHRELLARLDRACIKEDVEVDDKWRGPLPTKSFTRFEAAMNKPRKAKVALLVSARKRKVYVVKATSIPGYEPGCIIPGNAPLVEIMSITPSRLQMARHPRNHRAVSISGSGPADGFGSREASEFEFISGGERERFCAYLALAAAPDDAPLLKESGISTAIIPSKAAPGTVRSTYRQPSVADTSWLWGASWPHDDVKLWVGSYNVSGTPPPADEKDLDKWIPAPARDASKEGPRDLYVFGLQEVGAASNREAWGAMLAKHLAGKGDGTATAGARPASTGSSANVTYAASAAGEAEVQYTLVDHVYMWEMALWVFARAPHVPDITGVNKADLPTGLAVAKAITGVQLGNKGGVGIGLRWRETTIAFVMCHLAARPDLVRLRKRESDYKSITRKLKVETGLGGAGLDFVHSHDHVFFFGDLNYRIDLPFDRTVTLYKGKQYGAIVAHDQLIKEQGKRRVFVGFNEGKIDFAPSYRWERDREEFSWKRGQAPSYTDRVLHRSLPGVADKIAQTSYESPTFMWGSDHRPVGAGYTVGLRRYYSAPTPPATYVPYPVPTFFSATDASHLPVPAVLLTGLKISGVQALTAPAAIFLTLHAPWLDGGGVVCGTMTAVGLTDATKDALRALKTELSELAKADAKKRKEEAKESKAKAKAAKKAAKAKGEKEGPKVTVGGITKEDESKLQQQAAASAAATDKPDDAKAAPAPSGGFKSGFASMFGRKSDGGAAAKDAAAPADKKAGGDGKQAHATSDSAAAGGDDADGDDHDSEDELDDDADDDGGNRDDYTVLEEDAEFAASAAQAVSLMDAAGLDSKKKALLDVTVEYSWTPSDTAIPPLRPMCWDPRVLRHTHVHVVAHAAVGADGSYHAIGGSKAKVQQHQPGSTADVVGQAIIPLLPLIKQAQTAMEVAWQIQAEEEENDDTDAAVDAVLRGGKGGAPANSKFGKGGKKPKQVPVAPGPLEAEVSACTTGIIETTPDLFARQYMPDGTPWALTAPPVTFNVDVEFAGQPTGKLSGSAALRSSTDKAVSGRIGADGASLPATVFDLNAAITAVERSVRDAKAVGEGGNKSTFNIDNGVAPQLISRESFSELDSVEGGGSFSSNGAGDANGASLAEIMAGIAVRGGAGSGVADPRRKLKKQGSFVGGAMGGPGSPATGSYSPLDSSITMDDASSASASPRPSFAYPQPPNGVAGGMLPPPPPGYPSMATPPPPGYPSMATPPPPAAPGFAPPPPVPGYPAYPQQPGGDYSPSSAGQFDQQLLQAVSPSGAAPGAAAGYASPTAGMPAKVHVLKPAKPGQSVGFDQTAAGGFSPSAADGSGSPQVAFDATGQPTRAHALKPAKPGQLPGASPSSGNLAGLDAYAQQYEQQSGAAGGGSPAGAVRSAHHLKPSKPGNRGHAEEAAAGTKMALMTPAGGAQAGTAGAASMQVDARFAAFFEAQFGKKMNAGGAGGPDMDRLKALKPPKKPGHGTIPQPAAAAGADDVSGDAASSVTGSTTTAASIKSLKPPKKPTIPTPAGGASASPMDRLKALKPPKPAKAGGSGAAGEDAGAEEEEEDDREGGDTTAEDGATDGGRDSFFGDDSDDDDDDEEEEDDAAMKAARKKREAMAERIMTRAQQIMGLISAAADKARAETNQAVVALWMPGTAGSVIAHNVRHGVAASTTTATKHAYSTTGGGGFQGLNKILPTPQQNTGMGSKGATPATAGAPVTPTPAPVPAAAAPAPASPTTPSVEALSRTASHMSIASAASGGSEKAVPASTTAAAAAAGASVIAPPVKPIKKPTIPAPAAAPSAVAAPADEAGSGTGTGGDAATATAAPSAAGGSKIVPPAKPKKPTVPAPAAAADTSLDDTTASEPADQPSAPSASDAVPADIKAALMAAKSLKKPAPTNN